jgi:hypothetical protein
MHRKISAVVALLHITDTSRLSQIFSNDSGGERAAVINTLIQSAKLNDVDPRAWLADVLARMADHPASRIGELLPWNWRGARLPKQLQAG